MGIINDVLQTKELSDLQKEEVVASPNTQPELSENKVNHAINLLKSNSKRSFIEKARACKLSPGQLKRIKTMMGRRIAEIILEENPVEPVDPPVVMDKDAWTLEVARACYDAYQEILSRKGSESEVIVKYHFGTEIYKKMLKEVERLRKELSIMPLKDVVSDYLLKSKIKSDYGIKTYVAPKEEGELEVVVEK